MRRAIPVLVAGLSVLAACGGDDDEGAVTTATAAPTDTKEKSETTTATGSTSAGDTAPSTVVVPTDTDDAEGFPFTGPDGDYVVRFDDEPQEQTQSAPQPDGSTLDVTIFYDTDDEGTFFGVNSVDYGAGVEVSLEGARDGAIANVPGGTLVESEEIELQGRSGLQYVGEVTGQGDLIGRVFADGTRLYQLIVVGADVAPEDEAVAAFLDSFEFTEG